MSRPARPLISLIVACYNIERWIPELLRSLSREMTEDVEAIFVIDGATDATGEIVETWRDQVNHRVVVAKQENRGVASARNAGLSLATGQWVSFPDGDDRLGPGYLSTVTRFLRSAAAQSASLVSTNIVPFADATGTLTDDHPLRWKYTGGTQLLRLADRPEYIQLSASTAFLRLDTIRTRELRFDPRVKPSFEDGALIARYLLGEPDATVAVLPKATYLYRRRDDSSSLIQTGWSDPNKYDAVLRYGYLEILRQAHTQGPIPRWLQNTVLYDLSWYFRLDARVHTRTASLSPAQVETLHALLRQILALISAEAIEDFNVSTLPAEIRAAMLAVSGDLPVRPTVRLRARDYDQVLTQVSWYASVDGPNPEAITFTIGSSVVAPAFAKRRSITYFNRTLLQECIAWLPGLDQVSATYEGAPLTVSNRSSRSGALSDFSPNTSRLRALAGALRTGLTLLRRDRRRLLEIAGNLYRAAPRQNRSPLAVILATLRSKYRDCWLLMDRDTEAHDNAEHLYRYLRATRPDINAWFVLNSDSPDWSRLEAEGFRLLRYGSPGHAIALAQCRELISSQADQYIVNPPAGAWIRRRGWRFTWLGHGVTQLDLSRWLNAKPFSLVVATTPAEYRSFTEDLSPYVWTAREVALTGQPRHDELMRKASAAPEGARTRIVFMPTWRRHLVHDGVGYGNKHIPTAGFWTSEYARNWFNLLNSPALRDAAQNASLSVALMAHPNIGPHLAEATIPEHVTVLDYTRDDVQDVLAYASHVVTDYSSIAFDAAMIGRPVLYFQFDRLEFLGGSHIGRPGYFDYEADGFGPVATELGAAEQALIELIEHGSEPAEPYAGRAAAAFPLRDTNASERVTAAIELRRTQIKK